MEAIKRNYPEARTYTSPKIDEDYQRSSRDGRGSRDSSSRRESRYDDDRDRHRDRNRDYHRSSDYRSSDRDRSDYRSSRSDRDRDRSDYGGGRSSEYRSSDRDRSDYRSSDRRPSSYSSRGGGRSGYGGGRDGGFHSYWIEKGHGDGNSEIPAGVLPLSQWPRKLKNWDVAPPGYENMTASQVKMSGLFPLASQSIRNYEGGGHGGGGMGGMGFGHGGFSGLAQNNPAAQSANAVKQARRIYVGNLPPGLVDADVQEFFSKLLEDSNGRTGPGRPCVNSQIQSDQTYAFVEFRTPDEATQSIQFDGVQFNGSNLRIRRPREYVPQSNLEAINNLGLDSDHKVFIGEIPTYLTEDQVKELLLSFGELRSFTLAKETSGISKGYAFCEYLDPLITDSVIVGLNGMELGDKKLIVERASSSRARMAMNAEGASASLMSLLAQNDITTHPVLLLVNMLSSADLKADEASFLATIEDILSECSKFGTVISYKAPRNEPGKKLRGVGKVFVEFEDESQSKRAAETLHGRRFNERIVVTGYFPLADYQESKF